MSPRAPATPDTGKPDVAPKRERRKVGARKEAVPIEAAAVVAGIRDRIVEMKRVPTGEILANEKNWRTHPITQTRALAEVLDEVGIAGALTAYYSERNGGKLTLIDGHARLAQDADEWPVLILDVNDEEADHLLATLDPLTNMAGADSAKLNELLETVRPSGAAVADMLQKLRQPDDRAMTAQAQKAEARSQPMAEMELQPFEHYDYVVLVAKTTHDWTALCELLSIEEVQFTMINGAKRVGLGRVVDASRVVELLRERLTDEVPEEAS